MHLFRQSKKTVVSQLAFTKRVHLTSASMILDRHYKWITHFATSRDKASKYTKPKNTVTK